MTKEKNLLLIDDYGFFYKYIHYTDNYTCSCVESMTNFLTQFRLIDIFECVRVTDYIMVIHMVETPF